MSDTNDKGSFKESAENFAKDAKKTANEFTNNAKEAVNSQDNKKILAGLLGIFLGQFGVHKFILGYKKEGAIMLGVTVLGYVLACVGIGVILIAVVGIIGLIEGIIYLTKSDEEFYNTYQVGKKPWF